MIETPPSTSRTAPVIDLDASGVARGVLVMLVRGKALFRPGPLACGVVGSLLSLAALVCAARAGWLPLGRPDALSQTGV